MITTLVRFLPKETWPAVMVIGGFLVIFGMRRLGFGIVGTIILVALATPFIGAFIGILPPGLFVILCVFVAISVFGAIFGKRVSENVLSSLLFELIKAPFRLVAWLFRGPARRS